MGERTLRILLSGLSAPLLLAQAAALVWSSSGRVLGRPEAAGVVGFALVGGLATALVQARREVSPAETADETTRPGRIAWTIAGLLGLGWLIAFVLQAHNAATRPVTDWDGLYYHLPAIHAWLQAGRIVWVTPTDVPFVNGYPMAVETLGYLGVLLTGTDRWIDATNLLFWPLASVALALLAALWGASRPWRLAAAAAIALVPGFLLLSSTAYVDAAFAAASFALFAWSALWVRGDRDRSTALGWALAAALVLSIKGTGLPLVLVFTVALGGVTLCGRDARRRPIVLLGLAIALAFSLGGPWHLRAAHHTGNPLHPIGLRLGHKILLEGYDPHASADLALPGPLRSVPAILRGPLVWTHALRPVTAYDQAEGLGPLWTFLGLPALALWILRWRVPRGLTFLLVIGAVWWLVQPAPWWARFTLWLHGLGLPAAAALLSRLRIHDGSRRALAASVTLVLVASIGVSAQSLRSDAARGRDALGHPVDPLRHWFGDLGERPGFSELRAAAHVAHGPTGRFGALAVGALEQPLGRRRVDLVTDAAALDRLAERDLWVLWDEGAQGPAPAWLRARADRSERFRQGEDLCFEALHVVADPTAR